MKLRILLGLVVIFAVFGCKDSFDNFNPDPGDPGNPFNPIETTFNASVLVEVLGTDGQPIENAGITLGTVNATTDEFGVVLLDDVPMGTFTYLSVDKVGYFHGSRRFYPSADKLHFVKVTLLDEVLAGTVDAASGGLVTVDGGVSLSFPSNGVQNADGSAYSGQVEVFAHSIPANDADLSQRMPGDLVGETIDGQNGVLASMGMVAVELRSPSGDILQVAEGSTVEMTMDVPAEMISGAPSTIPMWYFDEQAGIWKEEGAATLASGRYTANVAHFTYWNYDAWFPIVKWGASFVFESGAPSTQLAVCITVPGLETSKCSWTNEDGVVCGLIPSNEVMLMEVKDPCGNVIYSLEIGPYTDSVMLGPITLPETSLNVTTVSGTALNCDGDPIDDGYVRVGSGSANYYAEVEPDGSWSIDFINCNSSDVTVTVVDEAELKQSLPQTFGFATMIDAGEISACDAIQEFVTIDIADTTFLWLFPSASVQGDFNSIFAFDSTGGSNGERFFSINWQGSDVGTFEDGQADIGLEIEPGTFVFSTGPVTIVVTYYGGPGDYIVGTISGEMQSETGGGTPVTYDYTGSFSVLRQ